jgi:hypothetical protein
MASGVFGRRLYYKIKTRYGMLLENYTAAAASGLCVGDHALY